MDDQQQPAQPLQQPEQGKGKPARYAAFDTRLQRFVGGIQPSEAKAKAAAKAMGVEPSHTQVRKV